jgi:type 1 fimbria pilin
MRRLLLPLLLTCAGTAAAGEGRIVFTGQITEPTCVTTTAGTTCSRPQRYTQRVHEDIALRHERQASLLTYAMQRNADVRWRVIETTYP